MRKISAEGLENAVFRLEEIKIVIRCPRETQFDMYNFKRKAPSNMTIAAWLSTRLSSIVEAFTVEVINGNGTNPAPHTKLETVRSSYNL